MSSLCGCLSPAALLGSRSRISEVARLAAEQLHCDSDHAHQEKEAGVLRVGSGCYSWQQQRLSLTL